MQSKDQQIIDKIKRLGLPELEDILTRLEQTQQTQSFTKYNMFSQVLDKCKPHRKEFNDIINSLNDIVQRCEKFLQSS